MDIIYLALYYFLKILFKITPEFAMDFFIKLIARLAHFFNKNHRKIILANLNLAFGDSKTALQKQTIIKDVYKNFVHFAFDFIQNQNTTQEKVLQKVTFINEEIFHKALKTQRPIIIQTAHYGNWELLSLAFAAKFGNISIVGRALDSQAINKILSKNRAQFHIQVIDKKNALRPMLKALRQKRFLGVLVDQNTTVNEGIEVKFFNKKVMHSNALSIIAKKTNALIIPVFIQKNSNNYHSIIAYEPLDINFHTTEEITQLQSNATQKIIESKPDEYFWFHRRFKHFYKEAYEKATLS